MRMIIVLTKVEWTLLILVLISLLMTLHPSLPPPPLKVTPEQCVVEGTVDGLAPHQLHHVKVHTYGDISGGCDR